MKNIFRAVAQTSFVLKGFKILMLVLLVTFGVTSCENQTRATPLTKSETVSDTTLIDVATQMDTENSLIGIGTNPGQERRNLVIGNQPAPRSLLEIGRQETSRRLVGIGGTQGAPRPLSEIGGQGCPRQFSEIGGIGGQETRKISDIGGNGGSVPPRSVFEITPDVIPIGGNYTPRS